MVESLHYQQCWAGGDAFESIVLGTKYDPMEWGKLIAGVALTSHLTEVPPSEREWCFRRLCLYDVGVPHSAFHKEEGERILPHLALVQP